MIYHRRSALFLVALTLLLSATPATRAHDVIDTTAVPTTADGTTDAGISLVSVAYDGLQTDNDSSFMQSDQGVSGDGRYVVFQSTGTNLVPGIADGIQHIYLRDTWLNETRLISRSTVGEKGNDSSYGPSISPDGRYIAYFSDASNLVPSDTNNTSDVFLHDRRTQTTERVSLTPSGVEHEGHAVRPSISDDGQYVAYEAGPGTTYVYVRDRQLETTTRVSAGPSGQLPNGHCQLADISADGRHVAFVSNATNLVAVPTSLYQNVFIHDRETGETSLVSVTWDGSLTSDHSTYPTVSADGRYVAFQSLSQKLVSGWTSPGVSHIYMRDRTLNQTVLLSVSPTGAAGNASSEAAALSTDGRYVTFYSRATNLVSEPSTPGRRHIYQRDLVAGATICISNAPDGSQGNGDSYNPSLSPDGRFIAFDSYASNLVPVDSNGMQDVFLYGSSTEPYLPTPLNLAEARTDRLDPGQTRLYSVDVDVPQGSLLVEVRPLMGIEALDLSARLGLVALVGRYDQRTLYPNADGVYALVIEPTLAGTYYVRLTGTGIVPPWGLYEIEARLITRHLTGVQPAAAGNAGTATLNIRGAGLDHAVQMRLQGSDLPTLIGKELTAASPAELWSSFDLMGVPVGLYDIAVAFSDGEALLLEGGFAVTSGSGGKLETRLIIPDAARMNRIYTVWVEYANVGDADLPVPLLAVSTSPSLPMRTMNSEVWLDGTAHLLGVNPIEPAGVLPPGARGRIPLIITVSTDETEVVTGLDVVQAAPEPIDWDSYAVTMRPAVYTETEWAALQPVLQAQLGTTWADYVAVLGRDATRLRPRGVDVYDVRQLLAFEIMRAAGGPIAATTGWAVDAETGTPLASAQVIARHQDGLAVRAEQSDAWGGFTVGFLPDGVYELHVEGYVVTPTMTVTLTQDSDANGVRIHASPIPPEPELDPPLVLYAEPQVLDVAGTPHLVVSVDGQIYHTTHDGTAWATAVPVPGARGYAPRVLYAPNLLDGMDPGLVLFWRTGTSNDAAIAYAAAREDGLGGWAWSETALYADHADAGSTNPAAVVDADGVPLVVWQMQDFSDSAADTDLYYDHDPVASVMLSWDEIAGLLVLDSPAQLDDGTVLPIGAVVALTRSGEAILVATSAEEWEDHVNFSFEFVKRGMVPRSVPYIGGQNLVRFNAGMAVTANARGAEASDSLGGEVNMMQERVKGFVIGNLSAHWAFDQRRCAFNLDKATLSTEVGIQGQFPIPQLTWEDSLFGTFRTEVGIQVGGSLTGALIWTAQGGNWPTGKVTGLLSLGFYGELTLLSAAEAEISGTGNLKATVSADGFQVSDIYFLGKASAEAGVLHFERRWRYPPESEPAMANGATLQEAVYAVLAEGMQVTTTVTLVAKPGATTVYGANAVLPTVSTDLVDDGVPGLVVGSDGLAYLFWHRESGDLSATLGNTLTYATYDGASWSAPQPVPGTLGFGREPKATLDVNNHLMVMWIQADAGDWTLESDPNDVLAAYREAEVRWTVLEADGTWSGPAALPGGTGDYHHLTLATLPSGIVWATWLQSDPVGAVLYGARWDGAAWSTPQIVTTGDVQGRAPAFLLGDTTSVLWAQGTDDPLLNYSQAAVLYTATYNGSTWSIPIPLNLELLPLERPAQAVAAINATATSWARLPVTVPSWVCQPADQDKANPEAFEESEEPDTSPDPPPAVRETVDRGWTSVVRPVDPNEKVGLLGFDTARWIDGRDPLRYTVYFENKSTATAPAQQVVISDTLPTDLAWTSLVLTEVAFGGRVLPVTKGQGGAYLLVDSPDYRPEVTKTWQVEIVADLDYVTGQLTVVMTTLDPETGEVPEDPLAGFLPPNDYTGRGEGRVSFEVMVDADLAIGTEIVNQADIIFDSETSIRTNAWLNTIGTPYAFSVTVVGDGAVLRDPWSDVYFPGQTVTLTALSRPGWTFAGWSGAATGTTNPLVLTIQADTAITATFEAEPAPTQYTLSIDVVGGGRVTTVPDKATYASGETITLTAIPDPGWTFAGWSGAATGTTNPLVLTIQADTAITATFEAEPAPTQYTLSIDVVGEGSVTTVPDKATYASGETITLTAIPDPGWTFAGWGGAVTGAANPLVITLQADTAVTATFRSRVHLPMVMRSSSHLSIVQHGRSQQVP